jgi:signal transduction histidine kinase
MAVRNQRAVWAIWGLVALFGLVEAAAWYVAGGIPTRPVVLVQVVTAWLVMRPKNGYDAGHIQAIQPIAEIFSVAVVAQQLQVALGKYRTMEAMSELTLSTAADINSALQTIIGHCDLLERGYPDPNLQRDLATVVRQAQRIESLLAKMRTAANERMREVEAAVSQATIPSSPEAFVDSSKPQA